MQLPPPIEDLAEDDLVFDNGEISFQEDGAILILWRPVEPGDGVKLRRFRDRAQQLHLARGIRSLEALAEVAGLEWKQLWLLHVSPWTHTDFTVFAGFETVTMLELLSTLEHVKIGDVGNVDHLDLTQLGAFASLDLSAAPSVRTVEIEITTSLPERLHLHPGVSLLKVSSGVGLASNYYAMWEIETKTLSFDLATVSGADGVETLESSHPVTFSQPDIIFPKVRVLRSKNESDFRELAKAFPNIEELQLWRLRRAEGLEDYLTGLERLQLVDLAFDGEIWTKAKVEALRKALPDARFYARLGSGGEHWIFNGTNWVEDLPK